MTKRGWFGNSQGHSLAAKGVRIYAARKKIDATMFYAVKREREMPFSDVMSQIRAGKTCHDVQKSHPGKEEEIRQKGIKAIESIDADSTLSVMDKQKVEDIVFRAKMSGTFKEKVKKILGNAQRRSFLKPEKAAALSERIGK